jgi:hypothetical protein
MTYKEKLMKEHPECVSDEYIGGCCGCPGKYWEGAPMVRKKDCDNYCTGCWNSEIPEEKTEKEPVTNTYNAEMILKIVDDAMTKKDRSVLLHVDPNGSVFIHVNPYEGTTPAWKKIDDGRRYLCPECGYTKNYIQPYCSICGTKLAPPKEDANDSVDG